MSQSLSGYLIPAKEGMRKGRRKEINKESRKREGHRKIRKKGEEPERRGRLEKEA